MTSLKNTTMEEFGRSEKSQRSIFLLGGITSLIAILGTVSDIIIGSMMEGTLSTIPETAIEKFAQFQENFLLALYQLDLLNLAITFFMIPTFFVLGWAHRKGNFAYVLLATVIYLIGATIFITNNTSLPMLELSIKYAASDLEAHKTLLAAAGEAYMVRGGHGSYGAFPGFLLSSIGSLIMAYGMLKGKVFSKATAYTGILGSVLLLIYVILVTFVPEIKNIAVTIAAPGGLLTLAWMIMFTIKLFRLGNPNK